MSKPSLPRKNPNPVTRTSVARVQSATARQSGGVVSKGSHVGRMQRAEARQGNDSTKK